MSDSQDQNDVASRLEQALQNTLEQLEATQQELVACKDKEQRALSDYQNLLRRTQQNNLRAQRLAAATFVETLLEPLSHLELAKNQLQDKGLEMVVGSLWTALEKNGLSKIAAEGQSFDLETMEVVQKGENSEIVTKIVQQGYTLNGTVIRHAKVILD